MKSVVAAAALTIAIVGIVSAQTAPVSKSATDLLTVEAWVTTHDAQPQAGLKPNDFHVEVDGQLRPVRVAEFVDFRAAPGSAVPTATTASDSSRPQGRSIVLLVDDLSFEGLSHRPLIQAAQRWFEHLSPRDRVAIMTTSGLGGTPSWASSNAEAGAVIERLTSQATANPLARTVRLEDLSQRTTEEIGDAVCRDRGARGEIDQKDIASCTLTTKPEVEQLAFATERATLDEQDAVLRVLHWLEQSDGPRVMVILSNGIPLAGSTGYLGAAKRVAQDTGTLVYGITPEIQQSGLSADLNSDARIANERFAKNGFDQLVNGLGGRMFRATTNPDLAFGTISGELSAFYRLGIDIPSDARLPPSVPILVSVSRSGTSVRTAARITPPPVKVIPMAPDERLKAVLSGDVTASAMPLNLSASLSRDASGSKIRVTTTVTTTGDVKGPLTASFMFVNDTTSETSSGTVANGEMVAGSYQSSFAVSLPAGRYRLRVAVEDADGNVGAVERGVLARLRPAGALFASDLQLRWKGDDGKWRVLAGEQLPAEARSIGAVLELYPDVSSAKPPAVTLTWNAEGRDVPLVSRALPVTSANGTWSVGAELDLAPLGAGAYDMRLELRSPDSPTPAVVSAHVRKETAASRASAVAGPAEAAAAPARLTSADVLKALSNDLANWRPAFTLDELVEPAFARTQVAAVARELGRQVPASLRTAATDAAWWQALGVSAADRAGGPLSAFASALVALREKDRAGADAALVRVLNAAPDSTTVMLYMGATQALGGRDGDAVGAWQMAAGGGTALGGPWQLALADATARTGDVAGAIALVRALPASTRTQPGTRRRLILLELAGGLADDAKTELGAGGLQLMDGADETFQFAAVALALAGSVAPSATGADITTFRSAATIYLNGNGAQAETVRRWLAAAGG